MNLAKDYFYEKHFSEEIRSEIFKNKNSRAEIVFFDRVFRRHHVANDPVNWVDPSGLARCTYSISTGRLSCTSNDGSSTGSANMFSGNNDPGSTGYKFGPIPIGKYDITKVPGANARDWFLDPGLLSRIGYRLKMNRGAFNLHLRKGGSDGCITGDRGENDNNFNNINNILNQDAGSNTLEVGF